MNRRKLLKSTAAAGVGSGIGLSQIVGSVVAETVTDAQRDRLENEESVRKILEELNEESLPSTKNIEKRRIDTEDPLLMTKARFSYGTLTIAEYQGEVGTIFTFADGDRSDAPAPYDDLPESDAALIETDGGLVFRRIATAEEEASLLSVVDENPDHADVYTDSTMDGFRVETVDTPSDSDETFQFTTYRIVGSIFEGFDPKRQEVPKGVANGSESAVTVERIDDEESENSSGGRGIQPAIDIDIPKPSNPKQVVRDLILDWAQSNIAGFAANQVFDECGTICVNCIDYVLSLLDCTSCRLVCSTGASPQGAVVCFLCIYMWCGQDPLSATECVVCGDCILTGEVSANPRQDIYESFPDPIEPPSWLSL